MIKIYMIYKNNIQKKEIKKNKRNLKNKNIYCLVNSKKKMNLNNNSIKILIKWNLNTNVLRKTI